jgi:hypothetical protein
LVSITLLQVANSQPVVTINGSFNYGLIDALKNPVLLTSNEIAKFNSNGKISARYSNNIFGNITSVDISDPLKPLVFFKDAQMAVYLNQQFSPVSNPVAISANNEFYATVACNQPSKGFWFFDSNNQTICRMNPLNQIDIRSNGVASELNGDEPINLFFMNNKLYLVCKSGLILTFDAFGNYLRSFRDQITGQAISQNGSLFFAINGTFYQWNDGNLKELTMCFETSEKPKILVQDNGLQMQIFRNKVVICSLN